MLEGGLGKLASHRFANYAVQVRLYTILPLPMLYGVWHTRGGSRGNHTLCDTNIL